MIQEVRDANVERKRIASAAVGPGIEIDVERRAIRIGRLHAPRLRPDKAVDGVRPFLVMPGELQNPAVKQVPALRHASRKRNENISLTALLAAAPEQPHRMSVSPPLASMTKYLRSEAPQGNTTAR